MKSFFKELFEYNHYYNQKLSGVFEAHPDETSKKSVRLFSHVLNAQQIWNNRIEPKQPASGVWDLHPAGNFKSMDTKNYEQTLQILDTCDLDKSISYSTSKGAPFGNTVRDILFHVINHSTYHRGQVATEFRLHGLEPLATDYILFKR